MNLKLLGVALVVVPLLAGCGGATSEPEAKEPAEPKTFDVRGTISINDADSVIPMEEPVSEYDDELGDYVEYYNASSECFGSGGYDDMRTGTQVVVRDSKGEQIAVGQIDSSRVSLDNTMALLGCTLKFSVAEVPESGEIYTVEVAHRGEVSFKREQASTLELSLG